MNSNAHLDALYQQWENELNAPLWDLPRIKALFEAGVDPSEPLRGISKMKERPIYAIDYMMDHCHFNGMENKLPGVALDLLEEMFKHGVTLDWTKLHPQSLNYDNIIKRAIIFQKNDCINMLIQKGMPIEKAFQWASYAVDLGNGVAAMHFVNQAPKGNFIQKEGVKVLHQAISMQKTALPLVELLIDKGVRVHEVRQGQSALHGALGHQTQAKEIVKVLLEAGADPWARDKKGFTVFQKAHQNGLEEVLQLLTAWREQGDLQKMISKVPKENQTASTLETQKKRTRL